jgi:hypothetical protein
MALVAQRWVAVRRGTQWPRSGWQRLTAVQAGIRPSIGEMVHMETSRPVYTYRGSIHVHSTYSDGLATVEQIAGQAAEAGVDFVIITDHNTLKGREDGLEGWYGDVLILISEEITPDTDSNHYLALGVGQAIPPLLDPAENIRAVRAAGGIGIVAHPTGGYMVHGEYKEYPWTNWRAGEFDGIEVWNHAYDITGKSKNLIQLGLWWLFPWLAPAGPVDEVLKVWDHFVASEGRPTVGIAGSDCHGMLSSYRKGLRSVCTYIVTEGPLTGSLSHDAALVYAAIRQGRCYVGADKVRDAAGFECYVSVGDERVHMGGVARLSRAPVLVVKSPAEGLIRVIRDGQLALEWRGMELEANINVRGAYRVEVALASGKRDKPWIYGNHIRVV